MKFLGRNKKGSDYLNALKLNVSENDIKDLKTNSIRYLIDKTTGNIEKINISDSPLLLRKFGVKKLKNSTLIKGGKITKQITISKQPISLSRPVTGRVECNIRVIWYSDKFWDVPESYIPIIDAKNEILFNEAAVRNEIKMTFLEQNPNIARDVEMGAAEVQINNLEL